MQSYNYDDLINFDDDSALPNEQISPGFEAQRDNFGEQIHLEMPLQHAVVGGDRMLEMPFENSNFIDPALLQYGPQPAVIRQSMLTELSPFHPDYDEPIEPEPQPGDVLQSAYEHAISGPYRLPEMSPFYPNASDQTALPQGFHDGDFGVDNVQQSDEAFFRPCPQGIRDYDESKTWGDYNKHLKTHVKTHWCTVDGCDFDKPFRSNHDLKRHMKTKHSMTREFYCPLDSCESKSLGFSRKDKLDEHIRNDHDNFRCPFDHCDAAVLDIERDAHIQNFHRDKREYGSSMAASCECALRGCESTSSMFNYVSANKHLRIHHSMSYDRAISVVWGSYKGASGNSNGSVNITSIRPHEACKVCLRTKNTTRSSQQTTDNDTSHIEISSASDISFAWAPLFGL